jgi:hypothetical protein
VLLAGSCICAPYISPPYPSHLSPHPAALPCPCPALPLPHHSPLQLLQAPLPGLVVHEAPLVLKVSEQPCLLLADDFLSPSECQAVRGLGGPHLKRSMVSAGGWRQGGG